MRHESVQVQNPSQKQLMMIVPNPTSISEQSESEEGRGSSFLKQNLDLTVDNFEEEEIKEEEGNDDKQGGAATLDLMIIKEE
jgi:hypothetical protein